MKNNLKELFGAYIKDCEYSRRLRRETIRGYEQVFSIFESLMPEISKPEEISMQVMTAFFERLETRTRIVGRGEKRVGVKISTVATYWSKLNSFFEWLKSSKYLEDNPLSSMSKPHPEYNDKRALEASEVTKIVTAVSTHSPNQFLFKRDLSMLFLLLYYGLRKTELISLRVVDIDLEKRTLRVRAETSKSPKDREMPMGRASLMQIKEYLAERKKRGYKTEYLIASGNNDKGLSGDGLKHWVKRLNKSSGVKFHLHQFRHSFACSLGKQGTSAVVIQKLMGHTDLRMTQRYLRSMGVEDLRGDMDRLVVDGLV